MSHTLGTLDSPHAAMRAEAAETLRRVTAGYTAAALLDVPASRSALVAPAVLDAYDFSGIGVLVDIAGGHGRLLASILDRYPLMRGVLVGEDHTIDGAREQFASPEFDARIALVTGDVFRSIPAGGDAYLLERVVHDCDDEPAVTILRNARVALGGRRNGRVLLIESIVGSGGRTGTAKHGDLEPLATTGGRGRTEAEYEALLEAAGLHLARIVPTASTMSVVEGRPR
jgi:hypothetical protein